MIFNNKTKKCDKYNKVSCEDDEVVYITDGYCPCTNGKGKCYCQSNICTCSEGILVYRDEYCPYGEKLDKCDNNVKLLHNDIYCPCNNRYSCKCISSDGCNCSDGVHVNENDYCPFSDGNCKNIVEITKKNVMCPCYNSNTCKCKIDDGKCECSFGVYVDDNEICPYFGVCINNVTISNAPFCPCKEGNGKCTCKRNDGNYCICLHGHYAKDGEMCPDYNVICSNYIMHPNQKTEPCPCDIGCKCGEDYLIQKDDVCPYYGVCSNNYIITLLNTYTECPCNDHTLCECYDGMRYDEVKRKCICEEEFIDMYGKCECRNFYPYTCFCQRNQLNTNTTCPEYNNICENDAIYKLNYKCPCNDMGICLCTSYKCDCDYETYVEEDGICPTGSVGNKTCNNTVIIKDSIFECPCKYGDGYCLCEGSNECKCSKNVLIGSGLYCPSPNGYCKNFPILTNGNTHCPCNNGTGTCICGTNGENCQCSRYVEIRNGDRCPTEDGYCHNDVVLTGSVTCPCKYGYGRCVCDNRYNNKCKCIGEIHVKKGEICPAYSDICSNYTINSTTSCPCEFCKCENSILYVKKGSKCPSYNICSSNVIISNTYTECQCRDTSKCICDYDMILNQDSRKCECPEGFILKNNECICNSTNCKCKNNVSIDKGSLCPSIKGYCKYGNYTTSDKCPCISGNGRCVCKYGSCKVNDYLYALKNEYFPYGDKNNMTCLSDVETLNQCDCKYGDGLCKCKSYKCMCYYGVEVKYNGFCPRYYGKCYSTVYLKNGGIRCPCLNIAKCYCESSGENCECSEGIEVRKGSYCNSYCRDDVILTKPNVKCPCEICLCNNGYYYNNTIKECIRLIPDPTPTDNPTYTPTDDNNPTYTPTDDINPTYTHTDDNNPTNKPTDDIYPTNAPSNKKQYIIPIIISILCLVLLLINIIIIIHLYHSYKSQKQEIRYSHMNDL